MKLFFSSLPLIIHEMHIHADEKENNLFSLCPEKKVTFVKETLLAHLVPSLFSIRLRKLKNKRIKFAFPFAFAVSQSVFIKIGKTVMVNKW